LQLAIASAVARTNALLRASDRICEHFVASTYGPPKSSQQ
jgi:hypothetical protein